MDKTDGKTKEKTTEGKDEEDHHHLNFLSKETLPLQMSHVFDKQRASWPSGTLEGKDQIHQGNPGSTSDSWISLTICGSVFWKGKTINVTRVYWQGRKKIKGALNSLANMAARSGSQS